MTEPFETVIAGSRAFALALFAPLTERVGTRPRIAADPAQAAALVPQAGLVIVELQDPAWLAALRKLVADRPTLRFVAALPSGAEAAAAPLRALGVEAIGWTSAAALLPLIDRALGLGENAQPAAPPPAPSAAPLAPPAVGPPPAARAPAPVAPSLVAQQLFDALDDEFDVDFADAALEGDPFAGAGAAQEPQDAAPVWSPTATWPANAPDLAISERALLAAVDGAAPPIPELADVAAQVAVSLSDIERAALLGASPGFDATPLRRAAAMRVRVGFAFASAPPAGSNSDSAAVAEFLGEIDELLSEVNALAATVPEEVAPALGACRNALVKEAIDFSEVAQRYVPVEVEPVPQEQRKPAKPSGGVRVLSDARVSETERRYERRQTRAWIVLALSLAVAAGYHGWNFVQQRQSAGSSAETTVPGAPAGMKAVAPPQGSGPRMLLPTAEKPSQTEVDSFKATEELKGNRVIQTPEGALIVLPGGGAPGAAAPSSPPAGSPAPEAKPR